VSRIHHPLGIALLAGILAIATSGSVRRIPRSFIPFSAFVLWNWLTAAWSIAPAESISRATTLTLDFILLWLIWEFARSEKSQRALMWAFVLGDSLLTAGSGVEFLTGRGAESRFAPTATNANGVALYAVFSICFLLQCLKAAPRQLRVFIWAYMVAAGITVVLAASRSGLLGLVICIVLSLVSFRRMGWKMALGIVCCLFVGWLLVPRVAAEALGTRLGKESLDRAVEVRADAWLNGLNAWRSNPLGGIGAGTYSAMDKAAGGRGIVAHNSFINVLAESGVVGLAIFVSAILTLVWLVWRMPPGQRLYSMMLLGAFAPDFISGASEYFKYTWFICALILTQAGALRHSNSPLPGRMPSKRTIGSGMRVWRKRHEV
jgi:O-antigen ligase